MALVSLTFLLPKLLVVDWARSVWIKLAPWATIEVLAQDAFLAVAIFLALRVALREAPPSRFVVLAVLSTVLLAVLMLDARVRQVWLRPTDTALIAYGLENRRDLGSGLPVFFQQRAGWGMTFRRTLVLVMAIHVALWVALSVVSRRTAQQAGPAPSPGPAGRAVRVRRLVAAGTLALLALVIVNGGHYRYRLQESLVIGPLVRAWSPGAVGGARFQTGDGFDQKERPFASTLGKPRRRLADVQPFRNLVLVFLESVRWRDVHPTDDGSPFPHLRRLAREGLLGRCYSPVPHSSKGYYSVLSGRYPYPGIEMRESFAFHHDGLAQVLKRRENTRTYAFSSLNLAFENTRGLLRALGVDRQYQVADLPGGGGAGSAAQQSSFGDDDGPLYERAARLLAREGAPFVAVFLPTAAHYPYGFPGKDPVLGSSHEAYRGALAYTDEMVGDLLARFADAGLDRDTLFVLVGDHGESFGEHGVFAHNSSLHEEEVVVPLFFWSRDGRMASPGPVDCRQIDVTPTILDLFGEFASDSSVQGESLLRADGPAPVYLSTFFDDLALGLVAHPMKYVYEPGTDHLVAFDLASDPLESVPVDYEGEGKADLVRRLREFQAHQRAAFPE